MPGRLAYRILTVADEDPRTPVNPLLPPGPRIVASAPMLLVMPDHGLRYRINQELEVLAPRIWSLMPPRGGVLLEMSIQERREVRENDDRSDRFNWITIQRPGPLPDLTLTTQLMLPVRRGRAAKGYVHRRVYLWATPADRR